MKHIILILSFLSIVDSSLAQKKFKDVQKFSDWMMDYYLKPEPSSLYDAFLFAASNKKLQTNDRREAVMGFFSAVFRQDTTIVHNFYEKLKDNRKDKTQVIFCLSLWASGTIFCQNVLNSLKAQSAYSKHRENIEQISKSKPFDVLNDEIKNGSHLDFCWIDFFVTGNVENIKRILSVINRNNLVSSAAEWSLTSNGIRYKKVHETITNAYDVEKEQSTKEILTRILNNIKKNQR